MQRGAAFSAPQRGLGGVGGELGVNTQVPGRVWSGWAGPELYVKCGILWMRCGVGVLRVKGSGLGRRMGVRGSELRPRGRGQSCKPRAEIRLQVSGQGSGLRTAQESQGLTPEEN